MTPAQVALLKVIVRHVRGIAAAAEEWLKHEEEALEQQRKK